MLAAMGSSNVMLNLYDDRQSRELKAKKYFKNVFLFSILTSQIVFVLCFYECYKSSVSIESQRKALKQNLNNIEMQIKELANRVNSNSSSQDFDHNVLQQKAVHLMRSIATSLPQNCYLTLFLLNEAKVILEGEFVGSSIHALQHFVDDYTKEHNLIKANQSQDMFSIIEHRFHLAFRRP